MWDAIAVGASVGIIYGTVEYIEYAGPWKALVVVPLMLVLGYLGVEVIYPLWFGGYNGRSKEKGRSR
jgi:hypothetical protein